MALVMTQASSEWLNLIVPCHLLRRAMIDRLRGHLKSERCALRARFRDLARSHHIFLASSLPPALTACTAPTLALLARAFILALTTRAVDSIAPSAAVLRCLLKVQVPVYGVDGQVLHFAVMMLWIHVHAITGQNLRVTVNCCTFASVQEFLCYNPYACQVMTVGEQAFRGDIHLQKTRTRKM